MPEAAVAFVSVVIALGAVVVPCLALWQRIKANKGIGWQFIRFMVIATGLPITAVLALNSLLTGEAATIIGAAMAYAFGHSEADTPIEKTLPKGKQDA